MCWWDVKPYSINQSIDLNQALLAELPTAALTDADEANAFIAFQKSQSHRDILEFLRSKCRSASVLLNESFARQHFNESDQSQTIREVGLEVCDVFVDDLQSLVGPACETVLLNQFPLGVDSQLTFTLGVIV